MNGIRWLGDECGECEIDGVLEATRGFLLEDGGILKIWKIGAMRRVECELAFNSRLSFDTDGHGTCRLVRHISIEINYRNGCYRIASVFVYVSLRASALRNQASLERFDRDVDGTMDYHIEPNDKKNK
jgi:hypothetical protein